MTVYSDHAEQANDRLQHTLSQCSRVILVICWTRVGQAPVGREVLEVRVFRSPCSFSRALLDSKFLQNWFAVTAQPYHYPELLFQSVHAPQDSSIIPPEPSKSLFPFFVVTLFQPWMSVQ